MPQTAQVISQQTIQVGANGPGDVTTLHIVTGIAQISLQAFSQNQQFQTQSSTFSAHVGPGLTAIQFRRAIASASLSALSLQGQGTLASWSVTGVQAEFDDDTNNVQLEFDVAVSVDAAAANTEVAAIGSVGFQVYILAA